jgi:hypothetical protein
MLELQQNQLMANGVAAFTRGVSSTVFNTLSLCSITPPITVTCACMPMSFSRNSRSNPLMTAITTMSTHTPIVTPAREMSVITETNVRLGLR